MSRPSLRARCAGRLGEHDVDFLVVRQIVERRHDRPAVHLALVDLLRAVIEARSVAEADRVGGGEQAERRMRANDAPLVEKGQTPRHFEHALDDEHHIGPAGVIFVEAKRDVVLQRPWQHAVAELRHLLAVLQHDRILADEIDARDVAVEIDADAGPVEPRGHLLDVGRLAGAVIAGDHHPAIEGEAGENGERRVAVEQIVRIEIRHMFSACEYAGASMSDSIPNTLRTEMRVSGRPGVGSAAVGVCLEFMGPPRFFPHGKERLCLTRIPVRGKSRPSNLRRPESLRFRPACWREDNYRPE